LTRRRNGMAWRNRRNGYESGVETGHEAAIRPFSAAYPTPCGAQPSDQF
jgi:hypothetical protein